MIRRQFNPSTAVWTALEVRYARLLPRIGSLAASQQKKRLVDHTTELDRFLPRSLLQLTLAEVAGLSFEEIRRTHAVGVTKIRNLLELLERAVREDDQKDQVSDHPDSAADAEFLDELTPARWAHWAESLKNHRWREIAIGRAADRLAEMPRSIWRVPVGAFVDLSLGDLRRLKSFGPRRIRAIAATVQSLHRALAAAAASNAVAVMPGPGCLAEMESWSLEVLCERRSVAADDLRTRVLEPLVALVRHDLGNDVAHVAAEMLLSSPNRSRLTAPLAAGKRASAYVRRHQMRRLIGEAISVRWPRGVKVLEALASHALPEAQINELQSVIRALRSFSPSIVSPESN